MADVIFAHKLRLLTHSLGLGMYEYLLQAADARDYFLQSGPTRPQWAR